MTDGNDGDRPQASHGAAPRRPFAHALRIGRVEVRRSVRALRRETNKLVGIGFTGLLLAVVTIVAAIALLQGGEGLLRSAADHPGPLRALFAGAWVFFAGITAFRTVSVVGAIDGQAGMLTSTSARAVFGGLLVGEAVRHAIYVGPSLLAVAGALSLGTGRPLVGVALLGTVLGAWAAAFPTGYLVGQSIRYATRAIGVVRRNRLALGVVGLAAYMVVVVAFGDLALVLADTPVGWYGDLALRATTGDGSAGRAAAAVVLTLLWSPVALVAAARVAVANWYGDPAADAPTADERRRGAAVRRAAGRLDNYVSRPTAAVVRASWLRARRSPFKLAYAIVPAFAFVGYLAPALREGRLPTGMPVMLAGYAAWSVGAAFTLNPIGDEGALLPVTVSSGVSGAAFLRGRMLAAWLPGVPTATVLVAAAALVTGDPLPTVLGSAIYAVVVTVAAPAVAVGIGTAIPNFETQRVMLSREAVVPSVVAFFGYLFTIGLVALPGGVALALHGDSPGVVRWIGLGATALLAVLFGVASYLYAVRLFENYEFDR